MEDRSNRLFDHRLLDEPRKIHREPDHFAHVKKLTTLRNLPAAEKDALAHLITTATQPDEKNFTYRYTIVDGIQDGVQLLACHSQAKELVAVFKKLAEDIDYVGDSAQALWWTIALALQDAISDFEEEFGARTAGRELRSLEE